MVQVGALSTLSGMKVHHKKASEHPAGEGATVMVPIAKLPPKKKRRGRRKR